MSKKRPQPASKAEAPAAPPATPIETERGALRAILRDTRPLLAAIVILGVTATALRFFQLGESNLWMDEVVMLREAGAQQYRIIARQGHVGHLIPVEWCLKIFGQTNFGLRFWSALLGSLAVPVLTWWSGLLLGRAGAWLLGALATFNCFLVMYAQDGNYYGGMTLYTAVLLLGFAFVLRGPAWSGFSVMAVAAAVGFLNHPIFLLPAASALGAAALACFILPDRRRQLITTNPTQWLRRPMLPLSVAAIAAGGLFLFTKGRKLLQIIDPTNPGLTNVEPGLGFLAREFHYLTVNFFRPDDDFSLISLLLLLPILAAIVLLALRRREESGAVALTVIFSVLLPIIAYATLFSIAVQRAYYTRYFIFLVPVLLFPVVYTLIRLQIPTIARQIGAGLLFIPSLIYTSIYISSDLRNYDSAIEAIGEIPPDNPIFVPHRNDLVQAEFFVAKAERNVTSPALSFLFEHGTAARYEAPLRAHLASGARFPILSAWREADAPGLWNLITKELPAPVRGLSRMGPAYDVVLAMPDGTLSYAPPKQRFSPLDSVAWPTHMYTRMEGEALRLERDDRLEFIIHQPDATPRALAVRISGRQPNDPIAAKNSVPLPGEFLLAVSVDGRIVSAHSVPCRPTETIALIPLELKEGFHRVGLHVTAPRLQYTPYFPWHFHGAEWRTLAPTDQPAAPLPLEPGWSQPIFFGDSTSQFSWAGTPRCVADDSLKTPAGDHPARLEYPAESKGIVSFFAPPVSVQPGRIAALSYYTRWEGMEHGESNGAIIFLDAAGKSLGQTPANGANFRGSLPPDVWVRRDIVVPVPEGVAAIAVGMQIMPIKPLHKTSGGIVYIGGFNGPATPGTTVDPLLQRAGKGLLHAQ